MRGRFKASTERYRIIGGVPYIGWLPCVTPEQVESYRQAGIRCRRLDVDLLVHKDDTERAKAVDRANSI